MELHRGKSPQAALLLQAGCLVSETSAERAPHTSIHSGVQRAKCCGPHRVEGRLIQIPPPPHSAARGDPHPSLLWRMFPLTPYRTRLLPHPWLPRCTSRTEPCGRGWWGGGVVPPAHSPTLTAGACGDSTLARELASLGLLRALRPHTLARSRPLIHTPALSSAGPPEGPGLHLSRHHPTPEPGLGYFRPPLPISRLEYKVWHCVAPDMVGRGFSPTWEVGQVGGLSHIPRPILYPRTVGLVNNSVTQGRSATSPHA